MLENLQGFHIETTNICTLKCPKCARTKFIEKFPKQWKNKNLDLDNLKAFLDISLENKIFKLCGNYGDPIYYDRLFELVNWIKKSSGKISIHTNGSYQSRSWWKDLVSNLDRNDSIFFGIDGLPDNFINYRINANWESILIGIEETVSKVKTIWQYIPFSYNIKHIDEAKELSIKLGFDDFFVLYSSRWNSLNDPYLPTQNLFNYKESIVKFNYNKNVIEEIKPKCKINNDEHFITADGFYLPCCYVGNHDFFYKSEFSKNKYDISKFTLSEILYSLNEFYSNLEVNKPIYCKYNCPHYE